MKGLRILVIDDSLITVKKLTHMLGELGHSVVHTASSGEEALAAFETSRPDLVTMDITMPGMSGIDAVENIVLRYPDAAIIMVTSHGQEKMVLDALRAGARGYVLKPFRQDKLQEAIEKAMMQFE